MQTIQKSRLDSSVNWESVLGDIKQSPKNGEPLYFRIFCSIKNSIESGAIAVNTKLPTNRELSKLLSVDRSTASRAYQELSKFGYTESFVGRGTFARLPENTSFTTDDTAGVDEIVWSQRFSKANQTVYDLFQSESSNYSWNEGQISFSGGIPTFESYPTGEFHKILEDLLAEDDSGKLFEYSPAEGHPDLRKEVLKHLKERGTPAIEEELLIVSGSQQGIDIVSSVFLDPGDKVALEDPTYVWATCSFKSRQAECLPIPLDEDGLRLDILESQIKRNRPKLIYVIPNFQNPTGLTMSMERRRELVELAIKYQVPILEDDFVGDLSFDGTTNPSLRAIAGGDKIVISQGTFSKALCPALRLGWIVAPKEVLKRLLLAKRASNLSTNSLSQILLADFLKKGAFKDHLVSVRRTYKGRRDAMLRQLNQDLSYIEDKDGNQVNIQWSTPQGGMFIWLKLPNGYSTKELLNHAKLFNVSFAPGHLCFFSSENNQYLRLCFIQHDEPVIKEGIKRLSKAIKSYIDEISQQRNLKSTHVFSGEGHNFI